MTAVSKYVPISLLALCVLARGVHAQPAPKAIDLFKEGRALAKANKFAEACEKFRQSQELDPQLGTLFNIAQCEEKIGKLASALAAYQEVAAKDTNAQRQALAAEFQSKLAPRVPKLVVQLESPPPGLSLTLDGPTGGKPIETNTPIALDFGDYNVIARANGYRELSISVKIATEGETKTVPIVLALVHAAETVTTTTVAPATTTAVVATAPPPHSRRKTYAVIGFIAGGALVAAGGVFGALAHSDWNNALSVCGGSTKCANPTDVMTANSDGSSATSNGNLSTALFVAGGAIAATGLVLWLTAPSDESAVHVSASYAPHGGGLTVGGRF